MVVVICFRDSATSFLGENSSESEGLYASESGWYYLLPFLQVCLSLIDTAPYALERVDPSTLGIEYIADGNRGDAVIIEDRKDKRQLKGICRQEG